MGILDRLLGSSDDSGGDDSTYTREDLRQDAVENGRINVMPVEKPSNRLWAAHPNMPNIEPKYEETVACHLFHPDSHLTLYPIHIPEKVGSNTEEEHFSLVLGIEPQMEVPFTIYSSENYFIPDGAVMFNRYEGGLLATPWGDVLVVPCDLVAPSNAESLEQEHTIPFPDRLHQKTIPKTMIEDEEMESYYNLAMSGMVRE